MSKGPTGQPIDACSTHSEHGRGHRRSFSQPPPAGATWRPTGRLRPWAAPGSRAGPGPGPAQHSTAPHLRPSVHRPARPFTSIMQWPVISSAGSPSSSVTCLRARGRLPGTGSRLAGAGQSCVEGMPAEGTGAHGGVWQVATSAMAGSAVTGGSPVHFHGCLSVANNGAHAQKRVGHHCRCRRGAAGARQG